MVVQSTQYKLLFQSKKLERQNNITYVMYKNMNQGKKSIANSFPLHQTYKPTIILKT